MEKIEDDDDAARVYIGLQSFAVLMWLFKLVLLVEFLLCIIVLSYQIQYADTTQK
jgi:hypothetical protein